MLDEFDYVILGDEPAGLWLIKRLVELYWRASTPETPTPKFAWIGFGASPSRVPVPQAICEDLSLNTSGPTWSPEILTPHRNVQWTAKSLQSHFPQVSSKLFTEDLAQSYSAARPIDLSRIRRAAQQRPDLIGLSHGIWKYFGRARTLQPEVMIWSSLLCTKMKWWVPEAEIPKQVAQITLNDSENAIEELKRLKNGAMAITFRGKGPVIAKKWILNTNEATLERLCMQSDDLVHLLCVENDLRSNQSLYPFELTTPSLNVPVPLSPVTVILDTEAIPEWDTEMQPFETVRNGDSTLIRMWVSGPRKLSLDTLLNKFEIGLGKLYRVLPHLRKADQTFSMPLNLDACASTLQREQALAQLEQKAVGIYQQTSFLTQSRSKHIFMLLPFINCHLPYPVGTLLAAKKLMPEMIGKKNLRQWSQPPQEHSTLSAEP